MTPKLNQKVVAGASIGSIILALIIYFTRTSEPKKNTDGAVHPQPEQVESSGGNAGDPEKLGKPATRPSAKFKTTGAPSQQPAGQVGRSDSDGEALSRFGINEINSEAQTQIETERKTISVKSRADTAQTEAEPAIVTAYDFRNEADEAESQPSAVQLLAQKNQREADKQAADEDARIKSVQAQKDAEKKGEKAEEVRELKRKSDEAARLAGQQAGESKRKADEAAAEQAKKSAARLVKKKPQFDAGRSKDEKKRKEYKRKQKLRPRGKSFCVITKI